MVKLFAVDSWSADQISGIADMGSMYVNFVSERGKTIRISFHSPFFKKDFKDEGHFAAVVGKHDPYSIFCEKSIKVRSLDYEDLIEVCRDKFPSAQYIPDD